MLRFELPKVFERSTSILATLDGLVQELSRKRENPRLDMTCLDFSWQ